MSEERIALIDADVLVYWSAFAAQKTRYKTAVETFNTNKEYEDHLKTLPVYVLAIGEGMGKRDAMNKAKAHLPAEKVVEVLPEGVAINLARKNLGEVVNQVGATSQELFISGAGNYRDEIATIKAYKANRVADKPTHYEAVRLWFAERADVKVSEGQEADDDIGIRQTELDGQGIICSIDKDLWMISGRHFNWKKDAKFTVNPDQADQWFWQQMLIGDTADNIPGIDGIGEKKAKDIVTACDCRDSRAEAVRLLYQGQYGEGWLAAMTEVGQLLWIRRKPGQVWTLNSYVDGTL